MDVFSQYSLKWKRKAARGKAVLLFHGQSL